MSALTVPLNLEPRETRASRSIAAHHARLVADRAHLKSALVRGQLRDEFDQRNPTRRNEFLAINQGLSGKGNVVAHTP